MKPVLVDLIVGFELFLALTDLFVRGSAQTDRKDATDVNGEAGIEQ
jgi:hypothetical protein